MRPTHGAVPGSYRFLVGGVSLLALFLNSRPWYLPIHVSTWEILVLGTMAAIPIVVLVPVVVRGDWLQKFLALVLLFIPAVSLVHAFFLATDLRWEYIFELF